MAHIPSPYFSASLPTIIDKPGAYITRSGEAVTVHAIQARDLFGCVGTYSNGVAESWHKSGRHFPATETQNDIVSHAE